MGVDGRDEELFWQHVQRSYRDAEESNDLDYAEAEALLQECEDAEPLPVEQVDRIVQRAMAMERQQAAPTDGSVSTGDTTSDDTMEAPEARRARPGWRLLKGAGRPLRGVAAAAVALASMPKLLIAGTVVAAIAVTFVQVRNTRTELDFDDALAIVANPAEHEDRREPAQGKVYTNVIEALTYLRRYADDEGELQPVASAAWSILGTLAAQMDPASTRPGITLPDDWQMGTENEPLATIVAAIEDGQLPLAQRQDAVMRLTRLAAQGLQALYTLSLEGGDDKMHRDNARQLARIRRLLSD